MVGRIVAQRFSIIELIDEGGMGSVWKAEDRLLRRTVALKFLSEALNFSDSARRRFLQGARSTSVLEHPGIATLYDAGEDEGRLYIAQTFVRGETVNQRISRGPLDVREALRIASEAAAALAHAHDRGVLHRDVSSRNVMIATDGHVVLVDFGLGAREDTSRATSAGSILGTLDYMAPEVARGQAASARSDLYGLGVILYQMLTGRLPFDGERAEARLYAASHRRPEPPSQHRSGIAPSVDRIALRTLKREPERRTPSARDLGVELERILLALDSAQEETRDVPGKGGDHEVTRAGPAAPSLPTTGRRTGGRSRRTLAILPFREVSANGASGAADQAFARGLAEALAVSISRQPNLRVIPYSPPSSASGGSADDLTATAQNLGASLVVTGTVRRSGPQIRVGLAVIDLRRSAQIGGETIEGSGDDPFALEDALLAAIVRALRLESLPRLLRLPAARAPEAHESYLRALGYLQRNDNLPMLDAAIRLLTGLLSSEGDTALVHAALGRAYFAHHELTFNPLFRQKAEASCRLALELDPHSSDVLITLARLHLKEGRYEEARIALRQSLELNPHNFDALLYLSRAHESLGQFAEAERAASEAIELRPHHWSGHSRLGMVYFRQGAYARAVEPWRRVVELTPDNAVLHNSLGSAFFQMGQLDNALASYRRSIDIAASATACFGAGTVHFFNGEHQEAVAMFDRSVTLAPRDARAWGNLADAQRWTPGLETASHASFDRAIELVRAQLLTNPHDADAWSRLALWLAKRGHTIESLEALRQAAAIAPESLNVRARAVSVHHLAGNRDEARAQFRAAVHGGYGRVELERDPELASLRKDPEIREFLISTAAGWEERNDRPQERGREGGTHSEEG